LCEQSSGLERNRAHVVTTLLCIYPSGPRDRALTPHMTVLREKVFADPADLATIPVARLGEALAILPQ
jgi:toxin CcdB